MDHPVSIAHTIFFREMIDIPDIIREEVLFA
jgi:hypothetical protein